MKRLSYSRICNENTIDPINLNIRVRYVQRKNFISLPHKLAKLRNYVFSAKRRKQAISRKSLLYTTRRRRQPNPIVIKETTHKVFF